MGKRTRHRHPYRNRSVGGKDVGRRARFTRGDTTLLIRSGWH
jgi:hypothetical protein